MREAFGVDINVILTGQAGGAAPANRPDEDELLAHYRAAHSDARERIRQIAATAANSPKRSPRASPPGSVHQVITAPVFGSVAGGNITNSHNNNK